MGLSIFCAAQKPRRSGGQVVGGVGGALVAVQQDGPAGATAKAVSACAFGQWARGGVSFALGSGGFASDATMRVEAILTCDDAHVHCRFGADRRKI